MIIATEEDGSYYTEVVDEATGAAQVRRVMSRGGSTVDSVGTGGGETVSVDGSSAFGDGGSEIESEISRLRNEYETDEWQLKGSLSVELRRQRHSTQQRLKSRHDRRTKRKMLEEAGLGASSASIATSTSTLSADGSSEEEAGIVEAQARADVGLQAEAAAGVEGCQAEEPQLPNSVPETVSRPKVPSLGLSMVIEASRESIDDSRNIVSAAIPPRVDEHAVSRQTAAKMAPKSPAKHSNKVQKSPSSVPHVGFLMLKLQLGVKFAIEHGVTSREALLCSALIQHVAFVMRDPEQAAALRLMAQNGDMRRLVDHAKHRTLLAAELQHSPKKKMLPLGDSPLRQLSVWGDSRAEDSTLNAHDWAVILRNAGIAAKRELTVSTAVSAISAVSAFKSAAERAGASDSKVEVRAPAHVEHGRKKKSAVTPAPSGAHFVKHIEDVLVMAAELAATIRSEFKSFDFDGDGQLGRADVETAIAWAGMAPDMLRVAGILSFGSPASSIPSIAARRVRRSNEAAATSSNDASPSRSKSGHSFSAVAAAKVRSPAARRRRHRRKRRTTLSIFEFAALVLSEARAADASAIGSRLGETTEVANEFDRTTIDGAEDTANKEEFATRPESTPAEQPSMLDVAKTLFSPSARKKVVGRYLATDAAQTRHWGVVVALCVLLAPLAVFIGPVRCHPHAARTVAYLVAPLYICAVGGIALWQLVPSGPVSVAEAFGPLVLFAVSLLFLVPFLLVANAVFFPGEMIESGGEVSWHVRHAMLRVVDSAGHKSQLVKIGLDVLFAVASGRDGKVSAEGANSQLGRIVRKELRHHSAATSSTGGDDDGDSGKHLGLGHIRSSANAAIAACAAIVVCATFVAARVLDLPTSGRAPFQAWPAVNGSMAWHDIAWAVMPASIFVVSVTAFAVCIMCIGLASHEQFSALCAHAATFNQLYEIATHDVQASPRAPRRSGTPAHIGASGLVRNPGQGNTRSREGATGRWLESTAGDGTLEVCIRVRRANDLHTFWHLRSVLVKLAHYTVRQFSLLLTGAVACQGLAFGALVVRAFGLYAPETTTASTTLWTDMCLLLVSVCLPAVLSRPLWLTHRYNELFVEPHQRWLLHLAQQDDAAAGVSVAANARTGLVEPLRVPIYTGVVHAVYLSPRHVAAVVKLSTLLSAVAFMLRVQFHYR